MNFRMRRVSRGTTVLATGIFVANVSAPETLAQDATVPETKTDAKSPVMDLHSVPPWVYSVPQWVYDARWYYIDVPRFHNGDRSNDPEKTGEWTAHVPRFVDDAPAVGGDLTGVTTRLPYLTQLGVNSLVLSAWGEETDDRAGTEREVQKLVEAAHASGIRVVLQLGNRYSSDEPNALLWPIRLVRRAGVDGLMMAHANGEGPLRSELRRLKRGAVILPMLESGRGSGPRTPSVCDLTWRTWLENPPIRTLVAQDDGSSAGIDQETLVVALTTVLPPKARSGATVRVLAGLRSGENDGIILATHGPRPQGSDYAYARLATVLKHFLPGGPITYFGDEVGMFSWTPMWWNDLPDPKTKSPDFRGDFFALVQWLHKMREQHKPLCRGDFRLVLNDARNKILSFARTLPGDEVILVMNYGDTKQKVMLPVGTPGQMVVALTPMIDPSTSRLARMQKGEYDRAKIEPLPVGGGLAFVNKHGEVRLWVDPMSIRVVLVNDKEPRRK